MLKEGDNAPSFELPDQSGRKQTLEGLLEQGNLVLYFYPADFTPVCTAEACAFRDHVDEVAEQGSHIVGISPQDSASHKRFAERFDLPFTLLSDVNRIAIKAYGVDGMMGMVRRATFLIDQSKTITKRAVSDFFVSSHIKLLDELKLG